MDFSFVSSAATDKCRGARFVFVRLNLVEDNHVCEHGLPLVATTAVEAHSLDMRIATGRNTVTLIVHRLQMPICDAACSDVVHPPLIWVVAVNKEPQPALHQANDASNARVPWILDPVVPLQANKRYDLATERLGGVDLVPIFEGMRAPIVPVAECATTL